MTAWGVGSLVQMVSTTQSGLSDFFWRLSRKARNWRLFLVCIFELPSVCTENLIRVDDVIESPKLAE